MDYKTFRLLDIGMDVFGRPPVVYSPENLGQFISLTGKEYLLLILAAIGKLPQGAKKMTVEELYEIYKHVDMAEEDKDKQLDPRQGVSLQKKDFYLLKLTAMEKLPPGAKQMTEDELHKAWKAAEKQNKQVQGKHTRAYLGKKHEHSVGLQVLVDEETRKGINAIAAVHNISTKDFLARLLKQEVAKSEVIVEQGEQILAKRKKRPYQSHLQSRLQEVEEENAALRKALKRKSADRSL